MGGVWPGQKRYVTLRIADCGGGPGCIVVVASADHADGIGSGVGDVCELPPTGQPACGCGDGMDGMMKSL